MIGIALIGCGVWGSAYLRTLNAMPEANLLYVCDQKRAVREMVAAKFPHIKVTGSYHPLLNDSDVQAVIIATPPHSHYEIAADCLTNGKAVLVEKPTTTNMKDTEKLVRLAQENKQILMTGHLMEYHPAVEILKNHISRGAFGDIKFLNFERTNCSVYRKDVSVLWDLTVHDLTIMFYLLESKPVWVSARGIKWNEDLPMGILLVSCGFSDHTLVHIHNNWHYSQKIRRLNIVGTEMMAEFDDTRKPGPKLTFLRPNAGVQNVAVPVEKPLQRQCAHFLNCVRRKKQPRSGGAGALRVIKMMEAIESSVLKKQIVYL
ncbi:putative dehydrogenase [Desulfohalotomaculum tongense]|uniref:Gfo/Idh/MocA family protein n=1 Tax=Desulforadius tongensis TaxID=1216062 RepID=UPI001958294D|nr:Gfo/Idh/MocA family oxidoreductase [Desulforadius tongensis]MBM7855537.1 putative dehydrogenase [Desulforadius tongensis]